jgi:predicted transcriptional regulator
MQEIKALVEHLPENAEIEDVQYYLYVLEKIRKGEQDIKDGRCHTTDEVRENLKQWLNP